MESKTYKIDRKSNSLDIVNLEYSNIDGYKIKPKVNKENTIKVDNIIFTNPSLIKKIIKKIQESVRGHSLYFYKEFIPFPLNIYQFVPSTIVAKSKNNKRVSESASSSFNGIKPFLK